MTGKSTWYGALVTVILALATTARAELLSYDGFETGAGHYTAGANLPAQSYDGTGYAAGGSWLGDDPADSSISSAGLTHIVASSGGKLVSAGSFGFTGTQAYLDVTGGGAFGLAGLVDGGLIGGGSVDGVLYVSFLARAQYTRPVAENAYSGLSLFRGSTDVQCLGGNYWAAWGYSLFGTSGEVTLLNNGGTGDFIEYDTATRLFVAKITFHAGGNDDLTVWMDPNPADGDSQGNYVYMYSGTGIGDLSFDNYSIRSGNTTTGGWDFDEIRFGTSWESVTPSRSLTGDLSYEGFDGYTIADLGNQYYRGTGYKADGYWYNLAAAFYNASGLTHAGLVAPAGGKAVHSGAAATLRGDLDVSPGGAFGQAQLLDRASGTIGGGSVSGSLYVSFLARAQNAAADIENAFSALALVRGGTEIQSLAGNHWTAWAYSLFGASGEVDLLNNGGTGDYIVYDTATRLFVAKITFNADGNDDLTVWMDPVRADGETQGAGVYMYSGTGIGDLSFTSYQIRTGNNPANSGWDFDEVRFATSFDAAFGPAYPPEGTVFIIK